MKNTGTGVGVSLTQADKIKTGILNRASKEIDNISKKTDEIDKMNEEFYVFIRKTRYPKTIAEQKWTTKKADIFRNGIGKRLEEITRGKKEIKEIVDTMYELEKIDNENPDTQRPSCISWVDIRQQIRKKMKKAKIK